MERFVLYRHINLKNCFAGGAFLDGEMPVVKADDLFAETQPDAAAF